MGNKLKHCPFCGSTSFCGDRFPELIDQDIVELYVVECNGCLARGPAKETPEEAESAWNRRYEPRQGIEFDYGAED